MLDTLYRFFAGQYARIAKTLRKGRADLVSAQAQRQELVATKAWSIDVAVDWNAEEQSLSVAIGNVLKRIIGDAIEETQGQYDKVGARVSWEIWDRAAVEFAKKYQYDLIKDISDSTRQQLGKAIGQWIEAGDEFPELVKKVRGIVPPTPYGQLRDRARLIAVTEVTRIRSDSSAAGMQAAGLTKAIWRTANDEWACPRCAPLNGREGTIAGGFINPVTGQSVLRPPFHPNCRCIIVSSTDELEALANQAPQPIEPQEIETPKPATATAAPKKPRRTAEPKPVITQRGKVVETVKAKQVQIAEINARAAAASARIKGIQEAYKAQYQVMQNLALATPEYHDANKTFQAIRAEHAEATKNAIDIDTERRKATVTARNAIVKSAKVKEGGDINVAIVSRELFPSSARIKKSALELSSVYHALKVNELAYVTAFYTPQGRAFYDDGSIYLSKKPQPRVVWHELGHWIEDKHPDVLVDAKDFLARRTIGEAAVKLSDITGYSGFEDSEVSKPDKFFDAYIGKEYPNATEVISMGVEAFMVDPVGFYEKDPEHFELILKALGMG
jgi:SPP1 gp7 family putative phage head morphogenesis protein